MKDRWRLKVEFIPTAEDHLFSVRNRKAIRRALNRRGRVARRNSPTVVEWLAAFLFIGGPVVSFVAALYLTKVASLLWLIGVAIMGAVLAFMVKAALIPRSDKAIRTEFEKTPKRTLPRSVVVDKIGFHYVAATWRCDIDWAGVLGVISLGEMVVVVDKENRAYFLSKHSIGGADQVQAFVAAIESHLEPKASDLSPGSQENVTQ